MMRGDSLQRAIIERRMEGKRGRGRPRQKLLDWRTSEGYSKELKEEKKNLVSVGLNVALLYFMVKDSMRSFRSTLGFQFTVLTAAGIKCYDCYMVYGYY